MFIVRNAGLETSVQDYPGRLGYRNQGFPPSGPMDSWSFRLANLLVGNAAGEAALECQFIGPSLEFYANGWIAITGADMQATLDGESVAMWTSVYVTSGQTLTLKFAKVGARSYIAFSGGIKSTPWLGSQSTFHKASVGGIEGNALKVEQTIETNSYQLSDSAPIVTVKLTAIPVIEDNSELTINVVAGPNDDWLDQQGMNTFLSSDWKLSGKSDRTGFRLEGPTLSFAEKAINKSSEHGAEPSNIIDQGYPVGAINLAGQTPIILVNDGPSMGGFINPFTVPSCEFWKLAHAKPGVTINFNEVSVEESQTMQKKISALCSTTSIINL